MQIDSSSVYLSVLLQPAKDWYDCFIDCELTEILFILARSYFHFSVTSMVVLKDFLEYNQHQNTWYCRRPTEMNRCLKMDTSQKFLNISSPVPLIGSFARELVLVTARVTTERTPGTCLYFSAAPQILPSSQPPIPCSEEGAGNATLSPRVAEECVSVWSHEGLVLTKLLTSVRACLSGFHKLPCRLLCREGPWS